MQVFEILFLLLFAIAIVRLLYAPIQSRLSNSTIAFAGVVLIVLGAVIEGHRWQMLPAQVGFALAMLLSLPFMRKRRLVKTLSAVALLFLLVTSAFFAHQLPIRSMPEPTGPFAVGTLEYSVTDPSRVERFSPNRNRELYVEAWYPADDAALNDYPVQSLYHELYEGESTIWSFLFAYLGHMSTHSHIDAPLATAAGGTFPVLLFNHGLDGFTSQNQLLMEHLASHGYVVLSIAHPYESIRVNLENAGTVRAGTARPTDVGFSVEEMEIDLLTKILALNDDREALTDTRRELLRLSEAYAAAEGELQRSVIVAEALESTELEPYRNLMTEQSLADYLAYVYFDQGRAVEYWVEDIQFIADSLTSIDAPVAAFSEALDTNRIGVFGMSMGGAAAGEFCKIDDRCKAGANIDGTQGGRHWNEKVAAPFLMIYHEAHRAGNDFAYLPPAHDFWDLTIAGTEHFDFVDLAYTMPLLKTLHLAGPIDGLRTIEILNSVHLDFFDRYLKESRNPVDPFSRFPEISIRDHEIGESTPGARATLLAAQSSR